MESLSLYLHIPFCSLKCAYCDFNSYASLEELIHPYDDALIEEIRLWGRVAQGWGPEPAPVATVFFGGGTPSLLPLPEIERIMGALREAFAVQPDAEVSLEANPGTVDLAYLRGLVAAGVNRLSFGVQSFHDDELKALDRIHSAAEAVEGFRWARKAGFERINLDFIYGLPSFDSPSASLRAAQGERAMERWQSTLEQAIALEPDHLSLYALTVEEGTKLAYDVNTGRVPEPDPDLQAEMYEWALERLDRAGYGQYEISNWARRGQECRHNLVYWRNGEWLGLGAGAHSHWAGHRFANVYSPKQYVERMAGAAGVDVTPPAAGLLQAMPQVSHIERQAQEMALADTAILGLRLNEGLDVAAFEARFGASLDAVYGPALSELSALGLLERDKGNLRLTPRGRLLANELFVRLLPD